MRRHTAATAVRITSSAALPKPRGDAQTAPNGQPFDHRFVASTELLASDGGVILLDAWRVGDWLRRPRWISSHNLWSDDLAETTLGKGVWAGVESGLPVEQVGESGRALTVYVAYADTEVAREVQALFDFGGLDDVSVRWRWDTEELRPPYAEEVARYGDGLQWVATRCDLVEISAVLLGADPGAQIIRSHAEEAFERVRSQGRRLPLLERFFSHPRTRVPVSRGEVLPDLLSAADTLDAATTVASGLSEWATAAAPLREQLADHLAHLGNLVMAASSAETNDAPSDLQMAFESLTAALGGFDIAARDLQPATRAIGAALEKLTQAFGLTSTHGRALVLDMDAVVADRTFVLDMDAVVADSAVERLWQSYRAAVGEKP